MNIFYDKMTQKTNKELLDILNEKEKYQDNAIIAVIEVLKERNYYDPNLNNHLPESYLLKDDPKYLFNQLTNHHYIIHKIQGDEILFEFDKIVGKNKKIRITKDKIEFVNYSLLNRNIIEICSSQITDIYVVVDPYNSTLTRNEYFYTLYPVYITIKTDYGETYDLIKIECLEEDIEKNEDYLTKLVEIINYILN